MLCVQKWSEVVGIGNLLLDHLRSQAKGSSIILTLYLQECTYTSLSQPKGANITSTHASLCRISHKTQNNRKKAWKCRRKDGLLIYFQNAAKLVSQGKNIFATIPPNHKQGTEFPLNSYFDCLEEKGREFTFPEPPSCSQHCEIDTVKGFIQVPYIFFIIHFTVLQMIGCFKKSIFTDSLAARLQEAFYALPGIFLCIPMSYGKQK